MPARPVWTVLPVLLLLAGCATTPAQRIAKNQDVFDSFPVAAQARIRGGQIDLGFNPAMVRIALGEPGRKLIRRSAEGEAEIWLYLDHVTSYDRQRVELEGLTVSGPGSIQTIGGGAWINVLQEKEVIRMRVEFKNGAVAFIEELAPPEAKK